jgi:hypothetical protein
MKTVDRNVPGIIHRLVIGLVWFACGSLTVSAASTVPPHLTQHSIQIDATALNPPTWWQVPGFTPMIMTLDPESTEAFRTTDSRELKLKPGKYRFGTFTFDFPFAVTTDGVLDYAKALDQCVNGRGTRTLTVTCSRTQPYGGTPDYKY